MNHSAIEVINSVAERYNNLGKKLTLIRLSKDCELLFKNAETITNVNIIYDSSDDSPHHYV